jgi:hypothetical protein
LPKISQVNVSDMNLAEEKLEIMQNILVLADPGIVRKAKEYIQKLVEQELAGEIELDEELPVATPKKAPVAEKKRSKKARVERSSIFEMDEYEREMEDRDRVAGFSAFDDSMEEFDSWGGAKNSGGYHDDDE